MLTYSVKDIFMEFLLPGTKNGLSNEFLYIYEK